MLIHNLSLIRYEEDGKPIFHKSEVNVILDEEVDIAKIPKGLLRPKQNMKQRVNRQRRHRRRKARSDKFNSLDLVSSNFCNMTITQEIIDEGTCSYFGSFCRYSGDRLKYNEVIFKYSQQYFVCLVCEKFTWSLLT